ncbi:hypothetical protein SAMN05444682_101600 [Parapedobacter indicus]|uniref:Uncharacterized protein n=1 Tax=Parapedobacter indicus TaxID=1477437 RepID=A0A1I3DRM7_9SPHI|nr:hypothetical protein CLV26_101614 [Parapedobacter indicus]SFH89208.1 hypothetical protein SAMN05444682_101600 [Parapedobacter indicus]
MKFFSSILAMYMMVLFVTPCDDNFEEDVFHGHEHTTEASHNHHDHSHDDHDHSDTTDMCTPFCVCGCCGAISGIVLQESLSDIGEVIDFDLSTFITYYKPVFIPRYFGEIWQPPKINA